MPDFTSEIADFAKNVLGRPLYPYQLEIAAAILASVHSGQGRIFTVMMARQMGKNQLSAVLEAYLLATHAEGTIIKAMPSLAGQRRNSHARLVHLLNASELQERLWSNKGLVGLAPTADPAQVRRRMGPSVAFYSAAPTSNVVGATADLLLEIDEAQDVQIEKFDRDFRPMAAVKNATTVLYGTAWSDRTLLAHQRAANLASEERTGVQCHFEHDWQALAAINPAYRTYVEREIERLGADHVSIQTQYCLHSIDGAGYLLNALQQTLLQGQHAWENEPDDDGWYIASMDVAGEERLDPGQSTTTLVRSASARTRRDSTVITLGRVQYNELHLPSIEIVHQEWWTGRSHNDQYAAALALVERWNAHMLVIDATGLGAGLASLLANYLGHARVRQFTFTRTSKSHLAYQMLALINSGRLKLYARAHAPAQIYTECWQQLTRARYRLPAPEILDMHVDPADGHDDFLISLALLTEAVNDLNQPIVSSAWLRPRSLYRNEGRF
ncbi:MAG: hypothetical protein ABI234_04630 [Ktedonobacteraceae bacterium]